MIMSPRHIVAGVLHMLAAAGGRFALAGIRPLARSRLSSSRRALAGHLLAAAGGRFALAGLRPLARSRLSSSRPLC